MSFQLHYHEGVLNDPGQRRPCGDQSADPHPCPYIADIGGDSSVICTCGSAQQSRCSEDI
jgi:hypothetical protein